MFVAVKTDAELRFPTFFCTGVDTIKRVQDLMQERDMNLCVLAKKCGISYSTIQTTARRGGQLSVETIERICQGLGITLKDFFDSSYL